MSGTLVAVVTFLISAVVCVPVGMVIRKKTAESKIKSAENNINGCLTLYALTSTLGLDPNSPEEKAENAQEIKDIWRENQRKVSQR